MKRRYRVIDARKGEAISRAATALFLKHGYEKTSMDAVARKAKVTKQTIYSHYRSKDQLFVRMINGLCKDHVMPDSLSGAREKTFDELLFEVGTSLLDLLTSPEGMAATRLVVAEAERHPKLAKLYYESGTQRITQLLADFLEEQNRRGFAAIPNTASAAAYFFSLLKGQYFLRMIIGVPPIPSEQEKAAHVRESVAIFLRIYGGGTPMVTTSTL